MVQAIIASTTALTSVLSVFLVLILVVCTFCARFLRLIAHCRRACARAQYSLMAMQLFMGHLQDRCYDIATGQLSNIASDAINNGPMCQTTGDLLPWFPGNKW